MNSIASKPTALSSQKLRSVVFRLLDAEIKYADFKLSTFTKSLLRSSLRHGRPTSEDGSVHTPNDKVFSIIENSSLHTTKLLYLRSSLTNWNAKKILYLLTKKEIKEMSLEEIKRLIK